MTGGGSSELQFLTCTITLSHQSDAVMKITTWDER